MHMTQRRPSRSRAHPRRVTAWLAALLMLFISSQYALAGPLMLARSGAMDVLACVNHQQGFLTAPEKHDHDDHAPVTHHDHSDCLLCFAPPVVDGSPQIVAVSRSAMVQTSSDSKLEIIHVWAEHHGVVDSRAPPSE